MIRSARHVAQVSTLTRTLKNTLKKNTASRYSL